MEDKDKVKFLIYNNSLVRMSIYILERGHATELLTAFEAHVIPFLRVHGRIDDADSNETNFVLNMEEVGMLEVLEINREY